MEIRRENRAWVGDANASWIDEPAGPQRKQKIFQVAVAGPLGQIKFRAMVAESNLTFDSVDSLRSVLTVIREGKLGDSTIHVRFLDASGSPRCHEVEDRDDVGDFEMLRNLVEELDDDILIALLKTVQCRLDTAPVWRAVGDLAESLYQQERVGSHQVLATVEKHALHASKKSAFA